MLARKSVRIKAAVHGSNDFLSVNSKMVLSNILELKGNRNEETKSLMEDCLAINIKTFGVDDEDVVILNISLADIHDSVADEISPVDARRKQIRVVSSYMKEAIRIRTLLSAVKE